MNFNVNIGGGGMNKGNVFSQNPQYAQFTNQYTQNNQLGMQLNSNQFGVNVTTNQNTMMIQPKFNLVAIGKGIDNKEYQTIVNCCTQAYLQKLTPLSTQSGKFIKNCLGNDWFVICGSAIEKDYDFSITTVEGGDFLAFTLDNTLFQVVKTSR